MEFGRKFNSAKIPADEPGFMLRAQDKFAADTIRFYANLVASAGASAEIVESARAQAAAFDAWPTKKSPDITPPTVHKTVPPTVKLPPR